MQLSSRSAESFTEHLVQKSHTSVVGDLKEYSLFLRVVFHRQIRSSFLLINQKKNKVF